MDNPVSGLVDGMPFLHILAKLAPSPVPAAVLSVWSHSEGSRETLSHLLTAFCERAEAPFYFVWASGD